MDSDLYDGAASALAMLREELVDVLQRKIGGLLPPLPSCPEHFLLRALDIVVYQRGSHTVDLSG